MLGEIRGFEFGDAGRCWKQSRKHLVQRNAALPASLKKVRVVRKLSAQKKMEGSRLFDMSMFSSFISSLVCPECYKCTLSTKNITRKRV